MAATVKRIKSTDPDYAVIHAAWVSNGRPGQFDILFQEDLIGEQDGGAIFNVLDTTVASPDFYMRYSKGPTLFNQNSAHKRPSQRGFLLLSRDYWRTQYGFDHNGQLKIQTDDAPNELV